MEKLINAALNTGDRFESDTIKTLAPSIYDAIVDELKEWANDESNSTTQEDVHEWKTNGFLVDVYVKEDGFDVTAGDSQQELNNQSTWFIAEYQFTPDREIENLLRSITKS